VYPPRIKVAFATILSAEGEIVKIFLALGFQNLPEILHYIHEYGILDKRKVSAG